MMKPLKPEKNVTLCADDFSLTLEISDAILQLIQKNRLSATSCMVNTTHWEEQAKQLKAYTDQIDIGLHFTLTDITPDLSPLFQHPYIIAQAYTHQIQQAHIEKELENQIKKFKSAMGKLPDFIDGHQHIHQLPIIRDALLTVYEKIFTNRHCYIRLPIMKPHTPKSRVIALTGASTLKNQLMCRNIPHNTSFSGIYNFKKAKNYSKLFPKFLKNIQSGGIIMCHPGCASNKQSDPITESREYEFNYLNSDRFLQDCKKQDVLLMRFLGSS